MANTSEAVLVPCRPVATLSRGPTSLVLGAATELRRAKDYAAALSRYEDALRDSPSASAMAGVLHCLRKLGRLNEALARLSDVAPAFAGAPDLELEIAWLRIDRDLRPLLERGHACGACLLACEILSASTDPELRAFVFFSTLRTAKAKKLWAGIDELTSLIDPETLSSRPRGMSREGWSDRARWCAARVVALAQTGRAEEALTLAQSAAQRHPAQRHDFERCQAQALALLGRHVEAIERYESVVAARPRDWWVLQELGLVRVKQGQLAEALTNLCRAGLACAKVEMGVQLLQDLAKVALAASQPALASSSADLALQVRQRAGWRVPVELRELCAAAGPLEVLAERDRLAQCRQLWRQQCGGDNTSPRPAPSSPDVGRQEGTLDDLSLTRPFCFIRTDKGSVFCLRADLPIGAVDGVRVTFNVVASFDRKKQQQSIRAADVRVVA